MILTAEETIYWEEKLSECLCDCLKTKFKPNYS